MLLVKAEGSVLVFMRAHACPYSPPFLSQAGILASSFVLAMLSSSSHLNFAYHSSHLCIRFHRYIRIGGAEVSNESPN